MKPFPLLALACTLLLSGCMSQDEPCVAIARNLNNPKPGEIAPMMPRGQAETVLGRVEATSSLRYTTADGYQTLEEIAQYSCESSWTTRWVTVATFRADTLAHFSVRPQYLWSIRGKNSYLNERLGQHARTLARSEHVRPNTVGIVSAGITGP